MGKNYKWHYSIKKLYWNTLFLNKSNMSIKHQYWYLIASCKPYSSNRLLMYFIQLSFWITISTERLVDSPKNFSALHLKCHSLETQISTNNHNPTITTQKNTLPNQENGAAPGGFIPSIIQKEIGLIRGLENFLLFLREGWQKNYLLQKVLECIKITKNPQPSPSMQFYL